MSVRAVPIALVLAVFVSGLSGCSGGGGGSAQMVKEENFVGTWLEQPSAATKSGDSTGPTRTRKRSETRKGRFQLIFNADKSFKLVACDDSGKPDASKAIEGTWSYTEDDIVFTVSKNTIGKDAVPNGYAGMSGAADKPFMNLKVSHGDSELVTYDRQ